VSIAPSERGAAASAPGPVRPDAQVRARGLTLGYGGAPIVSGVDLEIAPGEVWFLLGPNGSGKTTLLRALLGLLEPLAGELWLHPDVSDRAHVGYVPQSSAWSPALPTTVREFVGLGFVGTRASGEERRTALRWALARVGLESLALGDFRALSGGQRQRALLARALVRRPRVLVLDEPTEELDVPSARVLLDTLAQLVREEGTTLVFVTHVLELAARFATHVALFAGGRVSAGPRDAMLAADALARAFGAEVQLGGHHAGPLRAGEVGR
jgi:ABC-type Mn2+/Zn2+ transport system ATPase subunit